MGKDELTGFDAPISTPVTMRTLTAAGFTVTDFRRLPTHGEFICERQDAFGIRIPYLIAMWDDASPDEKELEYISQMAQNEGRLFLPIAELSTQGLGWQDFLDALGGAVPQWRALSEEYPEILLTSSRNQTPPQLAAEGWRLFEDAVADGLEFVLGRRVQRLGKRLPGKRVSDLVTRTPDDRIIIVDAKASLGPYDLNLPNLRPLQEYVEDWRTRQKGSLEVNSALIVARQFQQTESDLSTTCNQFLARTRIPLALLKVDVLQHVINQMKNHPLLRNRLSWKSIFCIVGTINKDQFDRELDQTVRLSKEGCQ